MAYSIEKRDFLFRFVSPNIRTQLRFDNEALYSTTDQLTADKITRDLLRFSPRSSIIADATACVGGNTYSFAQQFSQVYAFELDAIRAEHLQHNMRMLGMSNVHTISGDSIRKLPYLGTHFGVIFLDPPWGGPEYKNASSIRLSLSGKRLSDVCWQLSVHTDFIALKVPKNFDENEFLTDTAPFMSLIHKNTQLRKMHLLIFKVNPSRETGDSRAREERLAA